MAKQPRAKTDKARGKEKKSAQPPPQRFSKKIDVSTVAAKKKGAKRDVVRGNMSADAVQQNYTTYMSQLLDVLPGIISERIYNIYKDAWQYVSEHMASDNADTHRKHVIRVFQQLLGDIANWELERLQEETRVISGEIPYLREVIRHLLISRVAILMSYGNRRSGGEVEFEFVMPQNEEIVHTFMLRAAKRIRPKAFLYYHLVDDEVEIDANTLEAEEIIRASLERAIPALVPLQQVAQKHLTEHEPDEEDGEGEEEESFEYDEEEESFEYDEEEESFEFDEEEEEEAESAENSSEGTLNSKEEVAATEMEFVPPEQDNVDEEGEEKNKPLEHVAMTLAPEDTPIDTPASVVLSTDTPTEVKLKKKASTLLEMLDKLRAEREMTPKRQTAVIEALDEEIAERERQLARTEKRLQKDK